MRNSQYWRDPLKTYGAGTLLKAAKQSHADDLDALNNRMVAGGATMENQLAARQSSNEGMDKLYGQLLQGEDARRDSIDAQRMRLEQQHSAALQGGFMQAAQDWSQWGAQTAGAFMSLGSTGLLGDGAGAAAGAGKYAADMDKYRGALSAMDMIQPITGGQGLKTPVATAPLGGLAGGVPWNNG